ncbi:Protein serine/threonine phosphatase [Candidatus Methylobacter favarea]|uniref:Protein serine/threonine phosphatase n=1 Tax=Candidatus Methylobacter favarea TaxID=2707345 RepID=A0A8S0X014_9GAMM|nr:PP2C family serine/threonine-protein phosphatase [Candidatus Methylobacter favarea]CAA9890488.1 Protein serine/threonine phosphatase [Candidatus Methylobacter favarea]
MQDCRKIRTEKSVELEFYQFTSPGDRETNQDYMTYIIDDAYALFVVADGLGGHQAGEKASWFFCQGLRDVAPTYSKWMAHNPVKTFSAWIDDAVDEMRRLFADDRLAIKAHTTCAALYIDEQFVVTAHCGDSRIYRMNPQQILWRTRDHSIPQQLLNEGLITEQDIALHPEQNKVTRSINVRKKHEPEINLHPALEKGETFIICSDGFWAYVKQRDLLQLSQLSSAKTDLDKLARLLVLRAQGKSDNITVQWIRCH